MQHPVNNTIVPGRGSLEILDISDFCSLLFSFNEKGVDCVQLFYLLRTAVIAGDLSQCGHVMTLKTVHELKQDTIIRTIVRSLCSWKMDI